MVIIDAIVMPRSASTLDSRRVLGGDVDIGSAPATYLPPAIWASWVLHRMFGTTCLSLSVSVVGAIDPASLRMSSSACRSQNAGMKQEW
jgi:hypothetical protein